MINLTESVTSVKPIKSRSDLQQWWQRAVALPDVRVHVRGRGNNLYVLCEAPQVPQQQLIRSRAIRALLQQDLVALLPANAPAIYQINLYGKAVGQAQPDWVRVIYLNQLQAYARKLETLRQTARQTSMIPMPESDGPSTAILAQSNRQLAKQGDPEAIAGQLSECLSQQGIAVRATVKSLFHQGQELPMRRLVVYCEAAYSPDPTCLIEPIAKRLRGLALTTFRDALIYVQVQGESEPEWNLRIDLTPPTEILRMWARWGDVAAMLRLANQALAPQQIQVSGIVVDMLLHLTCWRSPSVGPAPFDIPPQSIVMNVLRELFESIAPQGVHALVVYGAVDAFTTPTLQNFAPELSTWDERIDLPAATQPQLAMTTTLLAQTGDLGAIGFVLTRMLNPDLDQKLATGGLRLQARYRDDLLHVMIDGTTLPPEKPTTDCVIGGVRSLEISGVNGVRIYGRRAGEQRPSWQYGHDFCDRARLVPEASPEFAASEAYVGDLITQQPGALVVRPPLNVTTYRRLWSQFVTRSRELLLDSQIFSPLANPRPINQRAGSDRVDVAWLQEIRLAAVWSAVGILMTVCVDQVLGGVMPLNQAPPPVTRTLPPPELSLSALTLGKTPKAGNATFNRTGFTGDSGRSVLANRPELALPSPAALTIGENGTTLVSSPVQPRGQVVSPAYQFNVTQLDQKLALYAQFVAQSGVPDVLIVGSSRALRGIDPVALQDGLSAQGYSGRKVFNFGVNGATAQMVDLLLRRLIPPAQLPKLVVWADGARSLNSGRVDVTYNAITTSPSYAKLALTEPQPTIAQATQASFADLAQTSTYLSQHYDVWNQRINQLFAKGSATYHKRSALLDWMRDRVLTKAVPISSALSAQLATATEGDDLEAIDVNGFLSLSARFNPTTYYQKFARVTGPNDADYSEFRLQGPQTESLQRIAEYVKQQGSALVFVNLPLSDDYLDVHRRKSETDFQQFMIQAAATFGFTYRNLTTAWPTTQDYFSDPSHLNRYGAYAVSQQLAQDPLIPWGAP